VLDKDDYAGNGGTHYNIREEIIHAVGQSLLDIKRNG
jgi:hypothetical protein